MSLMAINRTAKKYGWIVGSVMAALMIGGVVLSGLGSNIGSSGAGSARPGAGNEPVVVTVGDRKITKPELDQFADRLAQQQSSQNPMMPGKRPGPEEMDRYRLGAVEIFKRQQALEAVAKAQGIAASDADLRAEREKQWTSSRRAGVAQQLELPADATDAQIRSAIIKINPQLNLDRVKEMDLPDENLRLAFLANKLTEKYKSQIAVDEAAVRRSLSDMTVRRILIKFGTGALPEAQAKTKAEKLLTEVKANPQKMGDLAKANSNDDGSKAKGGVYEWTPTDRANIGTELKAALDTLKPGETYGELVRVSNSSDSGFHIIRLEAVKAGKEFPKDFDKNKEQLQKLYVDERTSKRVQEAVDAQTPSIKVAIEDPALQAEQYLSEGAKLGQSNKAEGDAKLNLALAELAKIQKQDDPLGIAPLKRAQVYSVLNKPKDAIAAYEDALTYRSTPEARFALAQAYLADKQNEKAKEQLDKMEEGVIPDPMMQIQVGSMYGQLGDKAKSDAAQKKAMEMIKQMQATAAAPTVPLAPTPAKK
ncbi:MAG: peptidylprolyl isomerase [Akkermansiaceae bacterium]|nr:peptidylprolyl isomerase [Armatimonadota bacterium]